MRRRIAAAAAVLALALALTATACGGKKSAKVNRPAVESQEQQFQAPNEGDPIAIFHTSKGEIRAVLYPDDAPMAVENFTGLVEQGYYHGLTFHRAVYGALVQGGDGTGTGLGGATIWRDNPFPVEPSDRLHHYAGALCVAHSEEDAASNLSQFYFVQALPGLDRSLQSQMEEAGVRQEVIDAYKEAGGLPYLDNRYTVFGQVYEGMDVVDAIAAVDTDENDKPTEDVLIEKVELAVYSTSES